jgi:hypothetical protein
MEMARLKRDGHAARRYRRKRATGGCEVCGWKPPAQTVLAVHHVIPLACGGTDADENLIVLCPKHHALARSVGKRTGKRYSGPRNKASFTLALRKAEKHTVLPYMQTAHLRLVRGGLESLRPGLSKQDILLKKAKNPSRREILRTLLSERDAGWTVWELWEATRIPPVEIQKILEDLHADGIAGCIIIPPSQQGVWVEMERFLS